MKPPQFRFFINPRATSPNYLYHRYSLEDKYATVVRSDRTYKSKNSLRTLEITCKEIEYSEAVLISANPNFNCNFNNKDENLGI